MPLCTEVRLIRRARWVARWGRSLGSLKLLQAPAVGSQLGHSVRVYPADMVIEYGILVSHEVSVRCDHRITSRIMLSGWEARHSR